MDWFSLTASNTNKYYKCSLLPITLSTSIAASVGSASANTSSFHGYRTINKLRQKKHSASQGRGKTTSQRYKN
ncbi:hypothetical protein BpHYR1_049944 [Brachionus plicatilis]|uniref:Uncharacterized protein n=1 Tax=Brachionus plicatilis TaxID=10195 RepID=A0A3M7RWA8_BRAPC|nr:hypothetical protein BpHYR1_049944 [Brachionus plicatilis]